MLVEETMPWNITCPDCATVQLVLVIACSMPRTQLWPVIPGSTLHPLDISSKAFCTLLVWFYFGELRSQHFPSLDLEILQSRKSHRHCMFPFKGMFPKCCATHLSKMPKFNAKDWQEWSECSASCGPGGRRKRIRSGGSTQRKCIANRKLNRGGWKD